MHLDHGGCRIHLIDTPGAPDFIGQSLPALEAVETAAIVINAAAAVDLRIDEAGQQRRAVKIVPCRL